MAFHVVNFRRKMEPVLQDHQSGNLFTVTGSIAQQTTNMASLVAKLRGSFMKIDSEFLKSLTGENGINVAKGFQRNTKSFESGGFKRM